MLPNSLLIHRIRSCVRYDGSLWPVRHPLMVWFRFYEPNRKLALRTLSSSTRSNSTSTDEEGESPGSVAISEDDSSIHGQDRTEVGIQQVSIHCEVNAAHC